MLTLQAGNTIQGVANSASKITCTIMGMELLGTTETYKVLDQRQLPNAAGTLYTTPVSTQAFVKSIYVVNTDTTAPFTFSLYINGSGVSNLITPLTSEISAGGMAVYEDGQGWNYYTRNGIILNGAGLYSDDAYQLVSGSKAETITRNILPEVNTAALSTGRLTLEAITIPAGVLLTSISFFSATTAAGTPTNQLFGLYDNSLALLRSTTNDTTTAWASNTRKTLNLTSTFTTTYTGLYYLGIMVTATTVPTLKGYTALTGGQLRGTAPILGGASTTGLTTTLPNPAAAITVSTTPIWGCVN